MFKHYHERVYEDFRHRALLHGYDIAPGDKTKSSAQPSKQTPNEIGAMMFKDPAEYAQMDADARQKMTDAMMGKYRQWAGKTPMNRDR